MANRSVCLKVDGWSNARFAWIEGNLVKFEAMWLGCDCSTCQARLHAIEIRMTESGHSWQVAVEQIPERGSSPSVILVVEPKVVPEKLDSFFSGLFGLQIREVA